ncbi:MAG: hypothetical protein J6K73_14110 [Clostridia bacterium]|nr:hypothetical protein [Clostridia bacterium]MBP3650904.1 hypothetical protein [Clostridia bacterium]
MHKGTLTGSSSCTVTNRGWISIEEVIALVFLIIWLLTTVFTTSKVRMLTVGIQQMGGQVQKLLIAGAVKS